MAKKKTDTLPYDGEKLRYQIESHNWVQAALSEDMGFAKGYLNRFCNQMFDEIPRRTTILLESYGIHYEDYKPDPKPEPVDEPLPWVNTPEVEEPRFVLTHADIERLCDAMHKTIYCAVYEAFRKALEE